MSGRLVGLFHRVPPWVRHGVASARGYYLRWWRYGPGTEAMIEEALERERWPPERLQRWQDETTRRLLHRAATKVPYYREYWRRAGAAGGDRPWEDLANWPVLSKDEIRENPHAFVADDRRTRAMMRLSTSGTSGTPLTMWRTRAANTQWYALFEARWRRWYGLTRHDRWAILGGQLVTPASQSEPPFWVWNQGLNQLYLSSIHLAPEHTEAYLGAMRNYGVRYLYGYASSMSTLAQHALDLGLDAPRLTVAISNAEPLLPHQCRAIERVFGCPARNTYGMTEIVAGASECAEGALHLWPEAGVVEVLDDDGRTLASGETGRLICTGLINRAMPLVRYEVGDRGAVSAEREPCACGRTLPRLARIEGRTIDNLVTRDGRRIFWLNPVLYGLPIREAQIVQERLDLVRVKVVPAAGFSRDDREAIAIRMTERMGDIEVQVETVDSIERGPNGKFRAIVRHVDA